MNSIKNHLLYHLSGILGAFDLFGAVPQAEKGNWFLAALSVAIGAWCISVAWRGIALDLYTKEQQRILDELKRISKK